MFFNTSESINDEVKKFEFVPFLFIPSFYLFSNPLPSILNNQDNLLPDTLIWQFYF